MIGASLQFLATLLLPPPEIPPPAPVTIRSEPFPGLDRPRSFSCATLMHGQTLHGSHHFGGISAFRLHGDRAYLLSDAGGVFAAEAVRDAEQWIIGFEDVEGGALLDQSLNRMDKKHADAEALVIELGRTALVSFENKNRVARFEIHQGSWRHRETLMTSDADILGLNSGFEGMARLQDGRLLLISEGVDEAGLALVLTQHGQGWAQRAYRPAPEFGVTDLATDPMTGDVLILERAFSRTKGPRARLVRVAASHVADTEDFTGQELARLHFLHGIDNMEGLIAERAQDGTLRLHMISDDNFKDHQHTVLMGLEVLETRACLP